jgi:hypothetical protein
MKAKNTLQRSHPFLSREKTNRTYRTVVLENEYLRITFLPELGGKIHEVIEERIRIYNPTERRFHVCEQRGGGECEP